MIAFPDTESQTLAEEALDWVVPSPQATVALNVSGNVAWKVASSMGPLAMF